VVADDEGRLRRCARGQQCHRAAGTAVPSAPPTCWLVVAGPETSPASAGVASDTVVVVTAGSARPAPIPRTISAGRMSTKQPPVGVRMSR